MPPTPKPLQLRQRRNKVSTAAVLVELPEGEKAKAPKLPPGRKWHARTRHWWAAIWASPMVSEYLDADLPGLFLLADLIDRYWTCKDPKQLVKLAGEIRQGTARFGLSPIDRRRLQWTVQRMGEGRRGAGDPVPIHRGRDPRSALA